MKRISIYAILTLYTLAQFTSVLFIGIPNSLGVYITFYFTSLYTLYFYKNRQILDWVLSIIIPPIILFIVILIVSSFFADYSADRSIVKILNIVFMFVLPLLACLFIIILTFKWIREKQYFDKFIKITLFIYLITGSIYGFSVFIFVASMASPSHDTYYDLIITYSFIFIYFCLPLILTIHAYINKKAQEAIFHLFYIVFAQFLVEPFLLSQMKMSIFILSLPFLFLLKNCLWNRQYEEKKEMNILNAFLVSSIMFLIGITAIVSSKIYDNTNKYHSFESYFENPEFQLKETIQDLLEGKANNEKGLSNDEN